MIVSTARGGTNYLYGFGGNDLICGGAGTDWIVGGPGKDKLLGGPGTAADDYLVGQGGNDLLKGKADASAYYGVAPGPVNVNLTTGRATGEGTDRLENIDHVFGSEYNDTLTGHDATNFMWGLGGNDTIFGGAEFDFIDPGLGDDVADGEDGDFDLIWFGISTDATTGAPLPVVVDLDAGTATGQGTDTFLNFEGAWGSDGADTLSGDAGNNAFMGGGGNDIFDGRQGFDAATYWLSTDPVTASLQTGTGGSTSEGTDTYSSIEALNGSITENDNLTGDNNDNILDGDGGDDVLVGNGGDDLFYVFGDPGDDTVDGGPGNHDYWDFFPEQSLNVNLVTGVITGQTFTSSITGVEGIGTADKADTITGDDQPNFFRAWGGNDTIVGGGGNDEIDAGDGLNDVVDGGAGQDDCTFGESLTSCESELGVRVHPLQDEADALASFRRNI